MKRKVIVRMRDLGCLQNLLPVVRKLWYQEVPVSIYLDSDGIAKEKFADVTFTGADELLTTTIPTGALVVSCLPLGEGHDIIKQQGNPVVLIQENPDWSDPRLADREYQRICILQKGPVHDQRAIVTGLPGIDDAVNTIGRVDRLKLRQKFALNDYPIVSVALPGDTAGCNRLLDLLGISLSDQVPIIRSHPKLKRDDPAGYNEVADRVDALNGLKIDLATANREITAIEAMALGLGEQNYFLTTHDSTMAWQAAAAGINNVFVLPPAEKQAEWEKTGPIITSGLGEVFQGKLYPRRGMSSLVTGYAVDSIVVVIKKSLH